MVVSTGQGDRHLSSLDLEALLLHSKEDDELLQLTDHLKGCPECQQLMERYRTESGRLELLKSSVAAGRADCPRREVWIDMAANVLDDVTSERLLDHAASCGLCGSRLKAAMEDLHSEDVPIEIAGALSQDFRRQVVASVVRTRRRSGAPSVRWWIAAATVAVVAPLGVWQWNNRTGDPEVLLARSYSARRTMEIRIPGAEYAPLRATKGPGAPEDERSVEAELLILRGLKADPDSPKWLQLRSRTELLRWQYDRAIGTLERLAAVHPNNTSIRADLGNAYLLRGTHQRTAGDLQKAVESLSVVIRQNREDSELFRLALFNRAIALEQLFMMDGAESDWVRYLSLDSQSGWAREAESRLKRIQEKKKAWRDGLRDSELQPAEFLAASLRNSRLPLEAYLDRAMKEWVPSMLQPGSPPEPAAAVRRLAALTMERHGDRWMTELLDGSRHPAFQAALVSLSGAIRANAEGKRDKGGELAAEAGRLFAAAGNTAGLLRAQIEHVYALSRTFRSAECAEESHDLAARLLGRNYRWAYGQLQLERSTCAVRSGNLGEAQVLIDDAIQQIRSAGYSTLLLRGLGFAANLELVLGRYGEANLRDQEGLELFWKGSYPPLRAYQFYVNMHEVAEREEHWEMGYFASKEAVPMIEMAGIPGTAATARDRLAMFAGVTQRPAEALSENKRAEEAFDQIKGDSGTATLRAESQLLLATSLLTTGQPDLSRQVLDRVRPADLQHSVLFRMTYHRAKGASALRQNDLSEGRRELTVAWGLAESAIAGMRTDRDRAHWKREAGPIYRHLVRLALDSDRDPDLALALWERFRSAPIHGFDETTPGPTTAVDIRRVAAGYRNASVLAYAELGDSLAGWFYDNRGIHPFRSAVKASEIAAQCVDLQRTVAHSDSPISEIRSRSRRLYEALIGPVERLLEPGRLLLVEPDGACSGIPFEILLDGQGTYLIDRFALATSPGAYAERALSSRFQPVGRALHALVVENPRLGSDLLGMYPPLPGSGREAELLTAAFSSHSRLGGAGATLDAVLAELPRAEVFYFGGHGASFTEGGGFLLAPRSNSGAALLDGASLEPALRRCRLAILSACSTAAGERMGPFNPSSLIQSLWRGGVPTVVATRWEVDERATTALMASLLRGLLSGATAPVALRSAMAEVRRSPGFEHPASWAAFHVFGVSPTEQRPKGM